MTNFKRENSGLIQDIIEESKCHNGEALIIMIDFERAFDSISCGFISKTQV